MAQTYLIRLRPNGPRERHVFMGKHFLKSVGWYEVPSSVAAAARKEPLNDMDPENSPKVFEVRTVDEVKLLEREEEAAPVVGTVDAPVKVEFPETEVETPQAPTRPARVRRAHTE